MLDWIIFAVVGKLFIFFWSKFPLPQKIENTKIGQLHSCGLCSGFWIYTALAFLLKINLLQLWFELGYVFVLSEIITGCVTSYVAHLISTGFETVHLRVTVI